MRRDEVAGILIWLMADVDPGGAEDPLQLELEIAGRCNSRRCTRLGRTDRISSADKEPIAQPAIARQSTF
jgi:hypothetical protein